MLILIFGILELGVGFPCLSLAEIYKFVDENGVVHFTNVPDKRYNLVLKEEWVRFHLGANFDKYDPETLDLKVSQRNKFKKT